MLQRIRQACKQGSFKLSNIVEVDETLIVTMVKEIFDQKL
jgi:hypothetical protein